MSSPSMPPDNSLQIEQMQEAQADKVRQQQQADAAEASAKLAQLRQSSRDSAGGTVDNYFQTQGVDPTSYEGDISTKLNSILAGISPDDPNPGAAFTNAGATVYGDLTSAAQQKSQRALDQYFAPNFETARVPFTLDDPYIDAIQSEQRANADNVLRNMFDRGVITNTGFNAGEQDLDRQAAGVHSRLNELGTGLLTDEQSQLRSIADKARQQAGTLKLGQSFDPNAFISQSDQNYSDFITNLSNNLRSKIGTGNLFSTAGLSGIAGAAQGAQNTVFDPNATAGVISQDDSTTKKTTPAQSSSVF